ncbi:hypothetical protein OG2516_13736 [Oceanicola granulosus HTCC2516]|uniref:Uncharacterized protein n=1 Tax=Oceanicola granulosus (strain ATCC BAA-861 / DSM 15982 / KCTC 12143 / HTCC2516) TaxID=314256 RepID=Q2CE00_OCEGH|nr:hypothetical protein [Oceanicola granulosus]EAR50938.1 hypothetical protein OG2516_13736 [Oceanicola granulosus HTCC2516]
MTVTVETLEGRLLAQRKLLARIVAEIGSERLDRFLSERDHLEAHEEDPGTSPDSGYGVEAALADELHRIDEEADRIRREHAAG